MPAVVEVLEPAAAEGLAAADWYCERSTAAAAAFELAIREGLAEPMKRTGLRPPLIARYVRLDPIGTVS